MKAKVIDKATAVSAAAVQFGADAIEDGINATKRVVDRSRRTTEDLINGTEYRVKRHPLNALGISFGVGLGLGALIAALFARNGHRCR